jgi:hypothetical protein
LDISDDDSDDEETIDVEESYETKVCVYKSKVINLCDFTMALCYCASTCGDIELWCLIFR